MGALTLELLGERPRRASAWHERFAVMTAGLVGEYGVPRLGNYRDPVREVFYILLSAKTTDSQYRRTFRALTARFPTLADLAAAEVPDILTCIESGGLARKKAAQIRATAAALLQLGGAKPARQLKNLSASDLFRFLTKLPGLGPKSAFCIMMYSLDYDVFPVDVNVQRIAERLGAIPPGLKHYQAQKRLPRHIPLGRSRELHIALVVHGRAVCRPRRPDCPACVIRPHCRHGRREEAARG